MFNIVRDFAGFIPQNVAHPLSRSYACRIVVNTNFHPEKSCGISAPFFGGMNFHLHYSAKLPKKIFSRSVYPANFSNASGRKINSVMKNEILFTISGISAERREDAALSRLEARFAISGPSYLCLRRLLALIHRVTVN